MRVKLRPGLARKMRATNDPLKAILILQDMLEMAGVWMGLDAMVAIRKALWETCPLAQDIDLGAEWVELETGEAE